MPKPKIAEAPAPIMFLLLLLVSASSINHHSLMKNDNSMLESRLNGHLCNGNRAIYTFSL